MKRLLLISYYFPPSGGPGVQRTLKFVKYLRASGWEPVVLTVDPRSAAYPSLDPSLAADVPEGVKVLRTRSWDPYGAYAALQRRRKSETVSVSFSGEGDPNVRQRLGRWFRGNVFLPDARVGWVPFALARARKLLKAESFDAMMTTGPPHSTHLVGLRLSRSSGVPWLADFRDPWTGIDFSHLLPSSGLARRIDGMLERRVLAGAHRVAIVSPYWAEHLASRYRRPYDVIMNGFDEDDFEIPNTPGQTAFTVAHLGSMDVSRDPEVLWRALREAGSEWPTTVRLVGRVDPGVLDSASDHGVADRVEVLDSVSHDEATRLMCESSILLLVVNRTPLANGVIPGKLFEYIGSGRPVLGIGPTDGDAARVLAESGAGVMFDYEDEEGVVGYIRRHIDAWSSGRPLLGASPSRARGYSRRHRTRDLGQILDQMRWEAHSG